MRAEMCDQISKLTLELGDLPVIGREKSSLDDKNPPVGKARQLGGLSRVGLLQCVFSCRGKTYLFSPIQWFLFSRLTATMFIDEIV